MHIHFKKAIAMLIYMFICLYTCIFICIFSCIIIRVLPYDYAIHFSSCGYRNMCSAIVGWTRAAESIFVDPSDGVFTRRHTAECAFCIVFYSVFCFSTMLPWGGGRNNCFFEWCFLPLSICTGFYSVFRAFALLFFCTICVFPWFLQCFQASWRRWCYATLGWGGC